VWLLFQQDLGHVTPNAELASFFRQDGFCCDYLRSSPQMNNKTPDIVIIGGGVMGVSIAHHLAASKCGSILVLEKKFIGAGSSGKSGAIIRQHYSTELLVRMARTGLLTFRRFEASTGSGSGWQNSGCLVVANEADKSAAEGNVRLMQDAGAQAELRTGELLKEVVPAAQFAEDEIGAWESEAGYVDPASVLHGYARSAQRMGAEIETGVEVTEVEIHRGQVASVITSSGRIETRTIVLCAGPWAGRLAARAGIDLPLEVVRPQVAFYRRPGDFPSDSHPVIADLANGFYCRPDSGHRTLIGALDVSLDERIANPDEYDESASSSFLQWSKTQAASRMPSMESSFGRGGYSGLYTFTPDSHPILGEAPAVRGLYLAVGFSGHGFKLSPAVGRGITELIASGSYQTLDLTPLRPTRFAEGSEIHSSYEYGLLS
jgi:sarcosine oxidase subunit beta